MKQSINEIKRMQQLAGIVVENKDYAINPSDWDKYYWRSVKKTNLLDLKPGMAVSFRFQPNAIIKKKYPNRAGLSGIITKINDNILTMVRKNGKNLNEIPLDQINPKEIYKVLLADSPEAIKDKKKNDKELEKGSTGGMEYQHPRDRYK